MRKLGVKKTIIKEELHKGLTESSLKNSSQSGRQSKSRTFVTFIVFGLREILIPWLTLEPLNYLVGIVLIFRIIYSMTQENLIELKGWGGYNFPKYRSFFLTSFVLAWCEQTSIFQYLGNVTLSSNVTILESFSTTSSISSFFTHCLYIFGISIGCSALDPKRLFKIFSRLMSVAFKLK